MNVLKWGTKLPFRLFASTKGTHQFDLEARVQLIPCPFVSCAKIANTSFTSQARRLVLIKQEGKLISQIRRGAEKMAINTLYLIARRCRGRYNDDSRRARCTRAAQSSCWTGTAARDRNNDERMQIAHRRRGGKMSDSGFAITYTVPTILRCDAPLSSHAAVLRTEICSMGTRSCASRGPIAMPIRSIRPTYPSLSLGSLILSHTVCNIFEGCWRADVCRAYLFDLID